MPTHDRNPYSYVLWQIGALSVSVSDRNCDGCGRDVQAARYTVKKRGRATATLVICYLCMKDITANHIDYINSKRMPS